VSSVRFQPERASRDTGEHGRQGLPLNFQTESEENMSDLKNSEIERLQRDLLHHGAPLAAAARENFINALDKVVAHNLVMGVDVGEGTPDYTAVALGRTDGSGVTHIREFGDSKMSNAMLRMAEAIRRESSADDLFQREYLADFSTFPTYGGISRGDQYRSPGFSLWPSAPATASNTLWWLSGNGGMQSQASAKASAPVCVLTPEEEAATKPDMNAIPRLTAAIAQSTVDELVADVAVKAEKLLGYNLLRKKAKLENPLLAVLRELDIQPFAPGGVMAYKLKAMNFRVAEIKRELLARPDFQSMTQHDVRAHTNVRWQRTALHSYQEEVPVFILAQAVSIAEKLPQAEFHVEHLALDPDPFLAVTFSGQTFRIGVWAEPDFELNL